MTVCLMFCYIEIHLEKSDIGDKIDTKMNNLFIHSIISIIELTCSHQFII